MNCCKQQRGNDCVPLVAATIELVRQALLDVPRGRVPIPSDAAVTPRNRWSSDARVRVGLQTRGEVIADQAAVYRLPCKLKDEDALLYRALLHATVRVAVDSTATGASDDAGGSAGESTPPWYRSGLTSSDEDLRCAAC